MVLAHHALAQRIGELEDGLHLIAHHLADRNAGPVRHHRGDGLFVDIGKDHAGFRVEVAEFGQQHGEPLPVGGEVLGRQFGGGGRRGRRRNRGGAAIAGDGRLGRRRGAAELDPKAIDLADDFAFALVLCGQQRELFADAGDLFVEFLHALGVVAPDVALPLDGLPFLLARLDRVVEVRNRGGHRALADGDAGAGRIEQAHRLVGQLPGGNVAGREFNRGDHRVVGNPDAMMGLHRLEDAAQHVAAFLDGGLFHIDRLEASGKGRIAFEILAIFRPGGGADGPQRAACQSRLQQVRRVAGTLRTAGADQGVGFVDEQDDADGRGLHLVDHRAQPLLELALHRGARLHEADIEGIQPRALELRRHVARGQPLREALDDRRLADAGFARKDRVVLPAAHQDVDDLADFVVAADDGIHLAGFGDRRHVDRKPPECRLRPAGAAFGRRAGGARRRQPRAVHRPQILFVRLRPDAARVIGELVALDLAQRAGNLLHHPPQLDALERRQQHVPGADLHLAEQQRRVVPATVEHVRQLRRHAGHAGFVLAQTVDGRRQLGQHAAAIELVVIERQRDIRALVVDDLEQPVRQLHIAVARILGLPERLHKRVVAEPIELAGNGFKADVGHWSCPTFARALAPPPALRRSARLKRASLR